MDGRLLWPLLVLFPHHKIRVGDILLQKVVTNIDELKEKKKKIRVGDYHRFMLCSFYEDDPGVSWDHKLKSWGNC